MERVNLKKFGFIPSKEDNFSDDGSYFYGYRFHGLRVSKCTYDGDLYLSVHGDLDNRLSWDEYHNLPHYRALDKLNGVSIAALKESDIEELAQASLLYLQEYEEAVAKAPTVDRDELLKKMTEAKEYAQSKLNQLNTDFDALSVLATCAQKYVPYNFLGSYRSLLNCARSDVEAEVDYKLENPAIARKYSIVDEIKRIDSYYNNIAEVIKNVVVA